MAATMKVPNAPHNQLKRAGRKTSRPTMMLTPAFSVWVHAIVRNLSILVLESGLLFGLFRNSFLSSGPRTLTRAIALALALALTLTMTVFRSLTFWSSSIPIWHIDSPPSFWRTIATANLSSSQSALLADLAFLSRFTLIRYSLRCLFYTTGNSIAPL